MLRFSSCLPKLTTVRAVMVRAALEKKNTLDCLLEASDILNCVANNWRHSPSRRQLAIARTVGSIMV